MRYNGQGVVRHKGINRGFNHDQSFFQIGKISFYNHTELLQPKLQLLILRKNQKFKCYNISKL